ncbi:hypothetical protein B0H12DRAFT_134886 [Mycena haematopus]|nr:hypothetical protein B0H12DRAFT_134886 [Mycena haematopus]
MCPRQSTYEPDTGVYRLTLPSSPPPIVSNSFYSPYSPYSVDQLVNTVRSASSFYSLSDHSLFPHNCTASSRLQRHACRTSPSPICRLRTPAYRRRLPGGTYFPLTSRTTSTSKPWRAASQTSPSHRTRQSTLYRLRGTALSSRSTPGTGPRAHFPSSASCSQSCASRSRCTYTAPSSSRSSRSRSAGTSCLRGDLTARTCGKDSSTAFSIVTGRKAWFCCKAILTCGGFRRITKDNG